MRNLELRNVRTYTRAQLRPASGIVVLAGANGVGKTNLLEALAICMLGTSPRTSSEYRLVQEGSAFARADLQVDLPGRRQDRSVVLQPGKGKQLVVDDVVARSVEEFASQAPCVVFLPEKLLVVRGAPARRRAALDRLATRLNPGAATVIADYGRAVAQRNALLRQGRGGRDIAAALAPWTAQVVELGEQLRTLRSASVAAASHAFRRRLRDLTGFEDGTLELDVRGTDLQATLRELEALDRRRGTTGAGPHLDDLRFLQGRRDLRAFGSTGEQRAALLAWSLAEADATLETTGIEPLLLLDEPYAELDADRRRRLSETLSGRAQAFVTTTEPPRHLTSARAGLSVDLHRVSFGTVQPWEDDATNH